MFTGAQICSPSLSVIPTCDDLHVIRHVSDEPSDVTRPQLLSLSQPESLPNCCLSHYVAEISHPQYALSKFLAHRTPKEQNIAVSKLVSFKSKVLGGNSKYQLKLIHTFLGRVHTFWYSIKQCFNLLRNFHSSSS